MRRKAWTQHECQLDALKYNTRTDWQKSSYAYYAARNNGWLDACSAHMEVRKKGPPFYWTYERCVLDAQRFKHKIEWMNANQTAYLRALKRGWMKDCTAHMVHASRPRQTRKWTDAQLIEDARNYKSVHEWRTYSAAYATAYRRGILEQCLENMYRPSKYTKATCQFEALEYYTIEEWIHGDPDSYMVAKEKGWLDDCTQHMDKN